MGKKDEKPKEVSADTANNTGQPYRPWSGVPEVVYLVLRAPNYRFGDISDAWPSKDGAMQTAGPNDLIVQYRMNLTMHLSLTPHL